MISDITITNILARKEEEETKDKIRSMQIKALATYIPHFATDDCWRAIQLMREVLSEGREGANHLSLLQAGNFINELTKMNNFTRKEIVQRLTKELDSFVDEADPEREKLKYIKYALQFLRLCYQQSTDDDEQQLIFDCIHEQLSNRNDWIRSFAMSELFSCRKNITAPILANVFQLAWQDLQSKNWFKPYTTLRVHNIVTVTPLEFVPKLIDSVRSHLNHKDDDIGWQAFLWLSKYTKFIPSSHVETVLAILQKDLTSDNPYMKLAAINALRHLRWQLQKEDKSAVIDNLLPFLKKKIYVRPYIIFAVWDCLKQYQQDMDERQIHLYQTLLMLQMNPYLSCHPYFREYLNKPHAELIGNLQEFKSRGLINGYHLDNKYERRNFYKEGCQLLASSNFSFSEGQLAAIIEFLIRQKLLRKLPIFGHYDFPQSKIEVLHNIIDDLIAGNNSKTNRYRIDNYSSLEILATFKTKLSREDKKKIAVLIYENIKKCDPIYYDDYLYFADNFVEDDEHLALRECVIEKFTYIITEHYPIDYMHRSLLKYLDDVSDEQREIIFSYLLQYAQKKAKYDKNFFNPHYDSEIKHLEAVLDIFKKLLPKLELTQVTQFQKILALHPDSRWALEIENLILSLFGLQIEWPEKSYVVQFIERMAAKEDCVPKITNSLPQCFFKPVHDQPPVYCKAETANQMPILQ